MLRVGETVGPYEILARLKSGGMATLFVGQKRGAAGFSRHVAIKVVHEHLASDEEFVRMFVDEALLQARIHHPNVVHVEELGETPTPDGGPTVHYLVMEYVYGCSLAQLLDSLARRSRRLSPELAVHMAIQTLAGLHAAHELKDERGANLGVVHRDVSPQNVLLAYEGHVKLIDFGVAKARNRSQQTTGASIKGKIRYMPPEQAMGVSAIDRRADVYALAIVLWEMLAFRKLFSSKDDLVLLDMVRNPKIVPPSTYSKDVPPALDKVVMKALAFRPEDRYATAQEFRRALAEALPKAMLVDASNVADLLIAVMAEQMQKDREALPSQLSAVVANEARRAADAIQADEVLKTMTVSAAGLGHLSDVSIDVDLPVQAGAPAPAFAAPPAGPAPMAAPPPGSESWSGTPALGTPAARGADAGGSRMPIVLGVVALVLVAIAAGAWFALGVQQGPIARSLSPETPTATPLPPETTGAAAVPVTTIPPLPTTPVVEPTGVEPTGVEPTGVEPPVTPPPASVAEPVPATAITPPHSAAPPPTTVTGAAGHVRTGSGTGTGGRRRPPSTGAGGSVPLADEW